MTNTEPDIYSSYIELARMEIEILERIDRINSAKMRIMDQPFTGIYSYKWTDREIRKLKLRDVERIEFNRIKLT